MPVCPVVGQRPGARRRGSIRVAVTMTTGMGSSTRRQRQPQRHACQAQNRKSGVDQFESHLRRLQVLNRLKSPLNLPIQLAPTEFDVAGLGSHPRHTETNKADLPT